MKEKWVEREREHWRANKPWIVLILPETVIWRVTDLSKEKLKGPPDGEQLRKD